MEGHPTAADEAAAAEAAAESQRGGLVNRVAKRAWFDPEFRRLLFQDTDAALMREFGEVPPLLKEVRFRATGVDRAYVRGKAGRRTLHVRPKRGHRPVSLVIRDFLGEREAVIVLYTRRCAYQCSFCTLPSASSHSMLSLDEVTGQLDRAREFVMASKEPVSRVALGNEGSLLDERTFSPDHLQMTVEFAQALPGAREIIIETRPEFVDEPALARLKKWQGRCALSLKVGLESRDDYIREHFLDKRMRLSDFESAVHAIAAYGHSLESYVLLKPHPGHTDEEARAEAISTCEYVKQLCAMAAVPLTLRINSMYRAKGSRWATMARQAGWEPPSVFDIAEVMWAVRGPGVQVFAGVSEEGLATVDGHFESRADFQPWALRSLESFNVTGRTEDLASVALHRSRAGL